MMLALFAAIFLAPILLGAQEPTEAPAQEPTQEQAQEPVQEPVANQPVSPLAAVHGVVLNSATSQPLARALVRLEGDAATGALTDGEGRFELPGVPSGPQIFQVLKPGYRDPSALANTNSEEPTGAEHNVLVAAQMPELVFTLTPTGAIRGQVELSTGDPASGVIVRLLRQSVQHGRAIWGEARFARTDTQGNYRFGGLPEGVYAVYNDPLLESEPATTLVEPGSDGSVARNGYPTVFYPDAHELAGAARIRLAAGDQARANMTLTLEPFHTVTATILSPDGHTLTLNPGATASAGGAAPVPALLDTEGHTLPYDAHYDDATHTVQATLPDGTYTLTVVLRGSGSSTDAESAQGYYPHNLVGAAEFVVAGQAVRNLRIPLFTPHSALLRLRAQRGGALPHAAVGVALSYAGEYRMDTGEERSAVDAGPEAFDLMLAPPFS